MRPSLVFVGFVAPILLSVVAWLGTASAATLDDVRATMLTGRYAEAATLGEKEGSSLGLALAAKALGYQARCEHDGDEDAQRPLFERAFELSGQAIDLNPRDGEAWLQRSRSYARTLNLRKDSIGLDEAFEVVDRLDTMLNNANTYAKKSGEAPMARSRVEIGKLVESRRFTGGLFSLFGDRELALSDACRATGIAASEPQGHTRTLVYMMIAEALWELDEDTYAGNATHYLKRALEPCENDALCVCLQKDARSLMADVRAVVGEGQPLARRICEPR